MSSLDSDVIDVLGIVLSHLMRLSFVFSHLMRLSLIEPNDRTFSDFMADRLGVNESQSCLRIIFS